MPWRLIIFIIILALFLTFITFNLANNCDISLGFIEFEDVPVFHIVFISFTLGLLCSIPIVWSARNKSKEKPEKNDLPVIRPDDSPIDALSAREKFLAKRNGGKPVNGGSNA